VARLRNLFYKVDFCSTHFLLPYIAKILHIILDIRLRIEYNDEIE